MNTITKRILAVWAGVLVAALAIVVFSVAHAQGIPMIPGGPRGFGGEARGPLIAAGIFGKVTAINGTTLTIAGGRPSGTTTTYTIDASNAVVIKNATTSSLSGVAIGDIILAQGKVTGSSIVAARIIDAPIPMGQFGRGRGGMFNASGTGMRFHGGMHPSGTPPFASGTFPGQGNWRDSSSTPSGTPWQMPSSTPPSSRPGFFGSIGNFFGNLFGRFRL